MRLSTGKGKLRGVRKLKEAISILREIGFGPKQSNEVAGYVLLAMLDLGPYDLWENAHSPLRGITPIIDFVAEKYRTRYAPNTRETIRDEAVKYFVEEGLLVKNPDKPTRPTNSGKTVYQIEPTAFNLCRAFKTETWVDTMTRYLAAKEDIKRDLQRARQIARIPVRLPFGKAITLSPGGQNPLIKAFIEQFCTRFVPGGVVLYVGDAENKFQHFETEYFARVGVQIDSASKMPDVVVHDPKRGWLVICEAVTSAGVVDGKRRRELKELFAGFRNGLVFVTAFEDRGAMGRFLSQISWETEVWIADDPDHVIHFNGERFLGPYPDTVS
ncbi:MAG: BsuBI/PstI family type II restriction endonuclease [Kiritimatiellae bacterium]|nr:BsuBI/PstI family type II restriction endonuclease [Kiritimatiellia bacterium]